jgi:hypothetical protein
MTEFTIGIAGRLIRIRALHEHAKEFCQNYLADGEPDFSVEIAPSDIDFERMKSAREDEMEGRAICHHSDEYLETLAIYRKIVEKMLDYNAFLFHVLMAVSFLLPSLQLLLFFLFFQPLKLL